MYTGIYRAKAVSVTAGQTPVLTAVVPQVFGDTPVTVIDFVGPPAAGMGWVLFQNGDPEFPVWMGLAVGGGGEETPTGNTQLWTWEGPKSARATVGATAVAVPSGGVATNDIPSQSHEVYISRVDSSGAIDWSNEISSLQAGDYLYLQYATDASSWHRYSVTGVPVENPSGTWTIPVTTDSGSPPGTAPSPGSLVLVQFQGVGGGGAQGPPGPPGPPGASYRTLVGGSISQLVTHNLGSRDVNVEVYRNTAPYDRIDCDVEHTDANSVTLRFLTAPTGNAYVCNVILGSVTSQSQVLGYVYNQATPAAVWTINHTLTFEPNVAVVDSANDEVEGDVKHVSPTQVVVTFNSAFAGKAILS